MQITPGNFSALLQTLSLTQGLSKPAPSPSVDSAGAVIRYSLPGFTSLDGTTQVSSSTVPPIRAATEGGVETDSDNSCSWEPYDPPPMGNLSFASFDQAKANIYRYRQQQSVNLGSWFVHEEWMTPSVFACAANNKASELDIAHGWQSTTGARAVLERHWDTFINETDFQYLASIGINTVRLPIGYWTLGPDFCHNTPYEDVADVYQNAWPRVIRTINLADAYGIGVLVDLHGAPGSQNGQQHSGVSDGATNLFDDPNLINQTMNVLSFLAKELTFVTNVVGIQLLNEPQNVPSLEDFYTNAISVVRAVYPNATSFPLYLHDGFDLNRFSNFVARRTDFIVQDHHSYFVFTSDDESEPASQHTSDIEGNIADSLQSASAKQRRNLVVDEFSCALTDESLKNEEDPNQARKEFCQGQMQVYANATAGWSFWAYRKEECSGDPGWCFTSAVGTALPPTFFSYSVSSNSTPADVSSTSGSSVNTTQSSVTSGSLSSASPNSYDPLYASAMDTGPAPLGFRRSFYSRDQHIPFTQAKRDEDEENPLGLTAEQMITIRGYTDGFLTAQAFARNGLSKLGFIGQFIADNIELLGPTVVTPGTEQMYEAGFVQGLYNGESAVADSLAMGQF